MEKAVHKDALQKIHNVIWMQDTIFEVFILFINSYGSYKKYAGDDIGKEINFA